MVFYHAALIALATVVAPTVALSGKATTTRYFDGQEGACGCGNSNGNFAWQEEISPGVYTAAGSQALFDADPNTSFCGTGCGQCYQLTSTGSAPPGEGAGGPVGEQIIVMVTNLCPYNGNQQWCPNPGQENEYGYSYHFDIMAHNSSLAPIIGDNPIVSFESIACPNQAAQDYEQCVCYTPSSSSPPTSSSSPHSTMTTSVVSTTSSAPSGYQTEYGQCGGKNWNGPTQCQPPYTCQQQGTNIYYSQCLPASG